MADAGGRQTRSERRETHSFAFKKCVGATRAAPAVSRGASRRRREAGCQRLAWTTSRPCEEGASPGHILQTGPCSPAWRPAGARGVGGGGAVPACVRGRPARVWSRPSCVRGRPAAAGAAGGTVRELRGVPTAGLLGGVPGRGGTAVLRAMISPHLPAHGSHRRALVRLLMRSEFSVTLTGRVRLLETRGLLCETEPAGSPQRTWPGRGQSPGEGRRKRTPGSSPLRLPARPPGAWPAAQGARLLSKPHSGKGTRGARPTASLRVRGNAA